MEFSRNLDLPGWGRWGLTCCVREQEGPRRAEHVTRKLAGTGRLLLAAVLSEAVPKALLLLTAKAKGNYPQEWITTFELLSDG
jgi:hypothetical protein